MSHVNLEIQKNQKNKKKKKIKKMIKVKKKMISNIMRRIYMKLNNK